MERFEGLCLAVAASASLLVSACIDAPLEPSSPPTLRTSEGIELTAIQGLSNAFKVNDQGTILGQQGVGFVIRTKQGKFETLPPVEGRAWRYVFDMNARGEVLGGDLAGQWIWRPNGKVVLLPGDYSWVALNGHGAVVGHRWDPTFTIARSAIFQRGHIEPLQGTGAALDLNDRGEAVGVDYGRPDPTSGGTRELPQMPLYWDRSGRQFEIDYVDVTQGATAASISNESHIVGWASDLTPVSAVRWHRAAEGAPYRYMGEYLAGSAWSQALYVNDEGVALGVHESSYIGGPWRAAVWLIDGTELELGTLGGIDYYEPFGRALPTFADGINNRGEVVGASPIAEAPYTYTAVRWTIPRSFWQHGNARVSATIAPVRTVDRHSPQPKLDLESAGGTAAMPPLLCNRGVSEFGVRALAECARRTAAEQ